MEQAAYECLLVIHTSDLNWINPAIKDSQEKTHLGTVRPCTTTFATFSFLPYHVLCSCGIVKEGSKGSHSAIKTITWKLLRIGCDMSLSGPEVFLAKQWEKIPNKCEGIMGCFIILSTVAWKQVLLPFPLSHTSNLYIFFYYFLTTPGPSYFPYHSTF